MEVSLAIVRVEMVSEAKRLFAMSLRSIREKRGLTQAALAKATGIHPTQISQWENEESPTFVGSDSLDLLAKGLDVTHADLLTGRTSKAFETLSLVPRPTKISLHDAVKIVNLHAGDIVIKVKKKKSK